MLSTWAIALWVSDGDEPVPGHELNPALPRKAFDRLTTLDRAAATRFNERPQLSRLSWGVGEFGRPIVCRGRGEG